MDNTKNIVEKVFDLIFDPVILVLDTIILPLEDVVKYSKNIISNTIYDTYDEIKKEN